MPAQPTGVTGSRVPCAAPVVANVRSQSSASPPFRVTVLSVSSGVVWVLPVAVGAAFVTVNVTVAETGGLVPSLTV